MKCSAFGRIAFLVTMFLCALLLKPSSASAIPFLYCPGTNVANEYNEAGNVSKTATCTNGTRPSMNCTSGGNTLECGNSATTCLDAFQGATASNCSHAQIECLNATNINKKTGTIDCPSGKQATCNCSFTSQDAFCRCLQ